MNEAIEQPDRVFGQNWMIFRDGYIVLLGSLCNKCNNYWFPKREICPACFSEQKSIVELSRTGVVYSYSIVHVGPNGFKTPYMIGYIDLPEGVRVCAQIEDWQENSVDFGTEVELCYGVIREDLDGTPVYSYKFKPLSKKKV